MNKTQSINILTLVKIFIDAVTQTSFAHECEATLNTDDGDIQGSVFEVGCVVGELVNDVQSWVSNLSIEELEND